MHSNQLGWSRIASQCFTTQDQILKGVKKVACDIARGLPIDFILRVQAAESLLWQQASGAVKNLSHWWWAGASAPWASPFCLFQEKNKTKNRKPNQTTTLVRHPGEVFVSRMAWVNCVGCSGNSQHPTGEMTEHMGGGRRGERHSSSSVFFFVLPLPPFPPA